MCKIDAALNLINHNKNREKWNADLSDPETSQFFSELMKDDKFYRLMDADLFELILVNIFNDLRYPNKKEFNSNDADKFINLLRRNLELNSKDYFIVLPVLGASLSNTIKISDNLSLIAGDRSDKINEIARLTGIEAEIINGNLEHTERSRSKYFLHHPLILLKVRHQYGTLQDNSEFLSLYLMNFIKLIYWSYVYPNFKKKGRFGSLKTFNEHYNEKIKNVNEHVVILGESNWGHRPIFFEHNFNYSLDWLSDKFYIGKLSSLMDLIDLTKRPTEIGSMFLRAIRFFNKSIISRSESGNRFFDIEADVILMLTIAAETVLLESQEERGKQKKVRGRLMRLTKYQDLNYSEDELRELINQMYRVRSGYVHEGIYHGYSEISSPENDIETYRKIIGRVLCDGNEHAENVLKLSEKLNNQQRKFG